MSIHTVILDSFIWPRVGTKTSRTKSMLTLKLPEDLLFYIFISFQDVPLLCTLIYIFLSVIRLLSYTQPTMILCGIGVGWIYLRYYQPHGKGIRGDMAESFEAASLFPPILR